MLRFTEEQKKFIKENFTESEKMIQSKDLNAVLLPLDALITYQGFDEEYQLNSWGDVAQRLYDEIYSQNKN